MASPLFQTIATLKGRLRLSGLPTGGDGESILNAAILEARIGFIRRLTLDTVNLILTYTASETPTNDEEAVRLLAEITEVKWVRMVIARTMTQMSLDGSGGAFEDFHNEAPFRETGPFEREQEIKRLEGEIEANLGLLSLREDVGTETIDNISIIESSETPPRPWDSIR